jgi:hypothetical protein
MQSSQLGFDTLVVPSPLSRIMNFYKGQISDRVHIEVVQTKE